MIFSNISTTVAQNPIPGRLKKGLKPLMSSLKVNDSFIFIPLFEEKKGKSVDLLTESLRLRLSAVPGEGEGVV